MFNLLKHSSIYNITRISVQNLLIFTTQCIYVFRTILTINSDYFPKQY
jgi:hypothetical protein